MAPASVSLNTWVAVIVISPGVYILSSPILIVIGKVMSLSLDCSESTASVGLALPLWRIYVPGDNSPRQIIL